MRYIYYITILFALLSCDNNKSTYNKTIPLFKSLELSEYNRTKDIRYNHKIIQLETSDSILLDWPVICDIKDSTMWIKSENIIYSFNIKNGKHLFTIDKRGNGPYEYSRIGDLQYSPVNQCLYLYDYITDKIITYSKTGENINQIKNDTINSMGITSEGDIIVAYNQFKSSSYLVGAYNMHFNHINSFIKNNTKISNVSLSRTNPIYKFNKKNCIYIPDTFYTITTDNVFPFLIIDKGRYKIPIEIESDASKKDIREHYIWNDYGFIVDQYLFLSFNYNKRNYFDLWNIKDKTLISRRCTKNTQQPGLPFEINGQTIYAWPNYVCNNKIYCILDNEQSLTLLPDFDIENNPAILEIVLEQQL
ncbi:6-bladed beta-propeller [Parabacteroides sp.]